MSRHVLLIEDEATLSLLLKERLEKEGYSVSACKDGVQGLAEALRGGFNLLVLDIRLPGRNGFDICHELRRHSKNVPILMLTARGEVKDRVRGLKMGADDYLTKPFDVAELLARMEALLRRANNTPVQFTDSIFSFGAVIVDLTKQEVLRNGMPVELTAKEFGLLRYFISKPNERLSRQALLEQVWGYKGVLNTRTVDLHIAQLRQKLEMNPRKPCHILTVFRSGYKFIPFPSSTALS